MSYATYYTNTPDTPDTELAPEGSTVTPAGRVVTSEGVELGEARLVLEVLRINREQLREFVYDLVDGRVLTSEQVAPKDMGMVFMPILFGALSPPEVVGSKPDLALSPQPAPPPPFVERAVPARPKPPELAVVPEKVRLDYEWSAIDKEDYDEAVACVEVVNVALLSAWEKETLDPWKKVERTNSLVNSKRKKAYDKACKNYYALKAAWAQECDRLRAEHEVHLAAWESVSKRVLSLWARDLGVVYAHMSEAGPRGINGNPMFMSMRLLHLEDWKLAFDAYNKEVARRKSDENLFGESGI